MGDVIEYEEDFSLLGQKDFEVVNALKFKNANKLTSEEIEKCEKVKAYINKNFDNIVKSTTWKFRSYNIEICPRCSKTSAYYFHGLDVISDTEVIILHCSICGFEINKHEKVISGHKEERGPLLPGTKIPFYSGVLVQNDYTE